MDLLLEQTGSDHFTAGSVHEDGTGTNWIILVHTKHNCSSPL
jgi:hypothetical protein